MRSSLLTNSATAAAKTVNNPTANVNISAQVASSALPPAEQTRTEAVLAKDRGISAPEKRAEGLFDDSPTDEEKEGAAPESVEEKRLTNTRRLLSVA